MREEWTRYITPASAWASGPQGAFPVPLPARYDWTVEADAVLELVGMGMSRDGLMARFLCRTCWEAPALPGTTICRVCGADPFDQEDDK